MKRKKDFLHIINDVDDKYVEEAMPPDRSGGGKSKRSIGPMLTKWLSVAACFALAVGIAFVAMNHNHNVLPPESSDCDAASRKSTDTFSLGGIMSVSEPEYSDELSFPEMSIAASVDEYPPEDVSGNSSEEVSEEVSGGFSEPDDEPPPQTSYDFTVKLYTWSADTIEELREAIRNTDIAGYFPISSASVEEANHHKINAQRCLEYIAENGMLLPSIAGAECSYRKLYYDGYFKDQYYMSYSSHFNYGLPGTVWHAYVSVCIPRCALDDGGIGCVPDDEGAAYAPGGGGTKPDIYELTKIDGRRIGELGSDELLHHGISEAYETRMNILGEERDVVCVTYLPTKNDSSYRVALKFIYGGYAVIYSFRLEQGETSFPYADMASMLGGVFYDDIEPPLPPKEITRPLTAEELGLAPGEKSTYVSTFRTYGELATWADFFEVEDVTALYGEDCPDELLLDMPLSIRWLGDPENDYIRPELSGTGFYIDSVSVIYNYKSGMRTLHALRAENDGEIPDFVALTQYYYLKNGALAEIYRLMGGDDEELLAEYCGRREVLDELGFDSAEVKHMKMLSGEGKAIVFEGRGDDGVVHKEIFYSYIYNECFVSFAYSCAEENETEADARMLKFLAESRDLRQEAFNNPD